jgi:hypothetical protein
MGGGALPDARGQNAHYLIIVQVAVEARVGVAMTIACRSAKDPYEVADRLGQPCPNTGPFSSSSAS